MNQTRTTIDQVFCLFYLAQNIFQIIINDVFDHGESIGNIYFAMEQVIFYRNIIISDCTILLSYVTMLLT